MKFSKYHALGNDYIVVDPQHLDRELTAREIKLLCDRHYGVGSDGVLYGPRHSDGCDFKLQIFNPDASEAEKSGNGLRIFARYLRDSGLVSDKKFSIETAGGTVFATVHSSAATVSVDMGEVRFTHERDSSPDIAAEQLSSAGETFRFYRASVGNPHCVIPVETLSPALPKRHGPNIENDSRFGNRTNVQFVRVIDRSTIDIEIWERGAGYTLASGSSSTAAAAVTYALDLCDSSISVRMPGGKLQIELTDQFHATMTGPVTRIANGVVSAEALSQ